MGFYHQPQKGKIVDQAKKKAGPPDSLSQRQVRINKRRTHKVRRQLDESYLDPDSTKSALVRGERRIEHPEDMWCNRFNPYW